MELRRPFAKRRREHAEVSLRRAHLVETVRAFMSAENDQGNPAFSGVQDSGQCIQQSRSAVDVDHARSAGSLRESRCHKHGSCFVEGLYVLDIGALDYGLQQGKVVAARFTENKASTFDSKLICKQLTGEVLSHSSAPLSRVSLAQFYR